MNEDSFGKRFLYCLALVFFMASAAAGAIMVASGIQWVLDDIRLSILPMRSIGLPESTAKGLSIMSSVAEVMAGLLFLDLKDVEKKIRNDPAYRVVLPILNQKTIVGAGVFFGIMGIYDLVTNAWGSFLENSNGIAVTLQVLFLTFSEYFVILGLAFVFAVIWFSVDVLKRMRQPEVA